MFALSAVSAAGAQTITPKHVAIVGSDYAFLDAPTVLPAGETLFAFQNRGTVRHEVNIRLLKQGVTVLEGMRAMLQPGPGGGAGAPPVSVVERNLGVLIAPAGDTAGGRIYARLIPGRYYAIVCVLRDKPDAPQHVVLGMIGGFTVPDKP